MTIDIVDQILSLPMEQRLEIMRDVCEKSISHVWLGLDLCDWLEKKANQFDKMLKKSRNVYYKGKK